MTTQRRTQRRIAWRKRNEDGASLVEYVLLLSLICLVCLVSVAYFGTSVGSRLSSVGSSIGAVPSP